MKQQRLFLLLLPFCLFVPFAHAEEIIDYHTNLFLAENGELHVTEVIQYDFGTLSKHGIFRTIPTELPDTPSHFWSERYVDITHVSVTIDGVPASFTETPSRTETVFKIGDADKTITGLHTYKISYDVTGALVTFTEGNVGLYWNAIGPDWTVPIRNQSATIKAAAGVFTGRTSCYSGSYSSVFPCEITTVSGGYTFVPTTQGIGGGVTIQQEVNVQHVIVQKLERIQLMWLLGTVFVVTISSIFFLWYRFKFKHRTQSPVIAEYEPYEGILPMHAGYTIDGRLDARDITSAVLYLAAEGYVKIERLPKTLLGFDISDYQITYLKDNAEDPFLRRVIDLLFVERPVGVAITLSELKKDRDRAIIRYATKKSLETALNESLFSQGLYERPYQKELKLILNFVCIPLLIVFIGLVYGLNYLPAYFSTYMILSLVLFILSTVILVLFGERRSAAGYEAKRNLEGFKLFLSVTGKDRFAFQSDPRNNPDIFMEYLPYAVAFGVEKHWAEVFADVMIPEPSWYHSASGTAFNAVALTSSLDAFSTTFSSSMRSAGATHSSGSFGGGFSGGGGGGGGGGSW